MVFVFGVFVTYSTYYCHFDSLWIHDLCMRIYVLMHECMYVCMHVCIHACVFLVLPYFVPEFGSVCHEFLF